MKFGPTAQISFKTYVFGRVQLEILSHVWDSHTILLTEFPPLASLVCGGNSRLKAVEKILRAYRFSVQQHCYKVIMICEHFNFISQEDIPELLKSSHDTE